MNQPENVLHKLPSRVLLDHRGPQCISTIDAIYFITIAALDRGGSALTDNAEIIMKAARHYQMSGRWFLFLFLIMPDHLHMLVHVPSCLLLSDVIGHWKSYLGAKHGIRFQENYFDTRIRDQDHYEEKWRYICRNPVAKGLVSTPRDWPHVIAFDPMSGAERKHR